MAKKNATGGQKLIDILKNKKENQEEFDLKVQNDEAEISAKQEILQVEKELSNNGKKIQELYSASPFSLSKIYSAEVERDLLTRKLNWLKDKAAELF